MAQAASRCGARKAPVWQSKRLDHKAVPRVTLRCPACRTVVRAAACCGDVYDSLVRLLVNHSVQYCVAAVAASSIPVVRLSCYTCYMLIQFISALGAGRCGRAISARPALFRLANPKRPCNKHRPFASPRPTLRGNNYIQANFVTIFRPS